MMRIFDGLRYYKLLTTAGFTEQQAEVIVELYKDVWLYTLNRLEDIKESHN